MQHIELKKIWEQLCQLWLCHEDLIPPAQEAERTHTATHLPAQENTELLSSVALHVSRMEERPDHNLTKHGSDSHSPYMALGTSH